MKEKLQDLIKNLNKQQREVVLETTSPCLVLSGPGTGKTHTLSTKILYNIIEQNIDPNKILTITFTNKAAFEMLSRLFKFYNHDLTSKVTFSNPIENFPFITTFHSLGIYLIKTHKEIFKFEKNPTILTREESQSHIKRHFKTKLETAKAIQVLIEEIKKTGQFKKDIPFQDIKNKIIQKNRNSETVLKLQELTLDLCWNYIKQCYKDHYIDYEDMLYLPYMALVKRENKQLMNFIKNKWEIFNIDEYQDTNNIQNELFLKIKNNSKKITVIGDDDQSIYSFRQANYKNIIDFKKNFKKTDNLKTFTLIKNYRSTNHIVNFSKSIIKQNKHRFDKNLISGNKQDKAIKPKLLTSRSEKELPILIKDLQNKNEKNIAILLRTNFQAYPIEVELKAQNIPYILYGQNSFLDKPEIQICFSILQYMINQNQIIFLEKFINFPSSGIGEKTLQFLHDHFFQNYTLEQILQKYDFNKKVQKRLETVNDTFNNYNMKHYKTCDQPLQEILTNLDITSYYKGLTSYADRNRYKNIEILFKILKKIPHNSINIETFLNQQKMIQDSRETSLENVDKKIQIMTIHKAKGLEFNTVIIPDCTDNIFPYISKQVRFKTNKEYDEHIEEERRIFYVAITRAKKNLILHYEQNIDTEQTSFINKSNHLDEHQLE